MNYTYGEFLFQAKSEDILTRLKVISEEEVKDACEYNIFLRRQDARCSCPGAGKKPAF
jgi:hypothetical protein